MAVYSPGIIAKLAPFWLCQFAGSERGSTTHKRRRSPMWKRNDAPTASDNYIGPNCRKRGASSRQASATASRKITASAKACTRSPGGSPFQPQDGRMWGFPWVVPGCPADRRICPAGQTRRYRNWPRGRWPGNSPPTFHRGCVQRASCSTWRFLFRRHRCRVISSNARGNRRLRLLRSRGLTV
jgi:hypothetical protein